MTYFQINEKLRDFELVFRDKDLINFNDAKDYLREALRQELDDGYVESFLEVLGYNNIEKVNKSDNNLDDLNLDEILNMDWLPNKDTQILRNNPGSHPQNTHLLNEFHVEEETAAFDRLVVENMKLVHKVASRYLKYVVNHQLSFEDLVSEGTIGLMKAIKKFDINRDVQFSTYAVWWIRQQIIRAIIDTGTTVRIPVYMFETVLRIKRAEHSNQLHGQIPDQTEICMQLGITPSVYKQAKLVEHRFLGNTSIDQYVSEEDQDTALGDFISFESHSYPGVYDEMFFNPSLIIEQNDVRTRIHQTISNHLKPREQEIIFERFGFVDNIPKTLEQLGRRFGVTRERIRQIEAKAIRKLRARMTRKTVRDDFQWPQQTIIGG
ncbi:RNA polymerase sigma factor RpoD/SigA [Brevibacillus composti]|uniref:RNA polymerase sigma factor n=1 Tax=Brevibacillus composti TaxID=2796470 RepID=A0A7T5ELG6_9BACL|nr:RNA polymerase sigma factor RpoD/SigA [Brevibacillus composti]QQE74727.1 RNA polymerase sigma factor RpoD/SigA [Brevibacillus composti]QUO41811.1 RNA polymerase sigma factor RpoD/SigA [Brevibacillus composti]